MKRLRVIVIAAVVLFLGWLLSHRIEPREPSYQGRRLSTWIYDYFDATRPHSKFPDPRATRQAAQHAIKEMGTNAIPTLLQWLQATDSPMKTRLNSLLNKQHYVRFRFLTAGQKQSMADLCLQTLGKDALPAVPALIKICQSGGSSQRAWALGSLLSITRDRETVLPLLLDLFHGPDASAQVVAAIYLHDNYPDAAEKAGVYQKFPQWKHSATNTVETNSPAAR